MLRMQAAADKFAEGAGLSRDDEQQFDDVRVGNGGS